MNAVRLSQEGIWKKNVPERANSKCKGHEMGAYPGVQETIGRPVRSKRTLREEGGNKGRNMGRGWESRSCRAP